MIRYFTFSLSIAFISWIVGMIITALLSKTNFYQQRLSSLNFLSNEKLNTVLGMQPFKWIILHSFFKYFNPKLSLSKKIKASELEMYREEMMKAELNHLFAFLFVVPFILFRLYQGLYWFALVMLFVNLIMNLYPTLLQQQNKRRIDRYLQVLKQRSASLI